MKNDVNTLEELKLIQEIEFLQRRLEHYDKALNLLSWVCFIKDTETSDCEKERKKYHFVWFDERDYKYWALKESEKQ